MSYTHVAFLRGVNVGGKALLKMADLTQALSDAGFENVKTYIQSGNVLFRSTKTNKQVLGNAIHKVIHDSFAIDTAVAVFSASEWQNAITHKPTWWGENSNWKHNMLILTGDETADQVVKAIGKLKPDIENIQAGDSVVYQSVLFTAFGKSVTGKLASHPLYKAMTIRNYNTSSKIADLMH